jgi:hypothetical protein
VLVRRSKEQILIQVTDEEHEQKLKQFECELEDRQVAKALRVIRKKKNRSFDPDVG